MEEDNGLSLRSTLVEGDMEEPRTNLIGFGSRIELRHHWFVFGFVR